MTTEGVSAGIVVGVDGSPSSAPALRWAAAEAAMRECPLVILYAIGPLLVVWPGVPAPVGLIDWQRSIGSRILDEAEQTAKSVTRGAARVSTELVFSPPVTALCDRSENALMVVAGSRGRGAVARAVLGSVSTGLVHAAHCPVAVIHDDESAPSTDPTAPVLLGFDGSPVSEAATALAFDEASRRKVDLVALHAWWSPGAFDFPGVVWEDVLPDVDMELSAQLARWQKQFPDVTVHRVVEPDLPAHRLVDHGRRAQVLVVGSHGHGGAASVLLGSVSTAVVQAARIPVIVVRPRR